MLKIALTGNIASGKSTVAGVWRELGARLVEADEMARRAVEPGTPGLARIVERWGEEVLLPSGALDRAKLRARIFRDPVERRRLEEIVHPEVARLREEAFREAEHGGCKLIVADIPLLYEVGLEAEFDVVVLVDAPAAERHRRLVEDRGLEPEEASRMIEAQAPAEEKRPRADLVIENDGPLGEVEQRARSVWGELCRMAGAAGGAHEG